MAVRRPDRLWLGRVVGVSGLRGWLKVYSGTQPREAIGEYPLWQLGKDGNWSEAQVERVKSQGKRVLGKLVGCDTRVAAEALVGLEIAIRPWQLAELPGGQYYWVDLQGLRVIGHATGELGTIKQIFATAANDVIVVRGERECLIPWILDDVIKAVDLQSGTVTVDWDPDF